MILRLDTSREASLGNCQVNFPILSILYIILAFYLKSILYNGNILRVLVRPVCIILMRPTGTATVLREITVKVCTTLNMVYNGHREMGLVLAGH